MRIQIHEMNQETSTASGKIFGTPCVFCVQVTNSTTHKRINNGTIVKLEIKDISPIGNGAPLSLFDNGWIIGPDTNGETQILKAVLQKCEGLFGSVIKKT